MSTRVVALPASFVPRPLPLCAHCGLPVSGGRVVPNEPLYCCGGCALAHRLSGGESGHGQETGLLMSVGIGFFLAMNVMMGSFVLYTQGSEADRLVGEAWVRWALLALATPAMVLLGAPFLVRGFRRLRGRVLDTDALIVIGVAAAYTLSLRSVLAGHGPMYLDTAMGILLFVTIGRYLEASARARTTDALAVLAARLPSEASRVTESGEERVAVDALRPGDRIRVRPGERIAADGIVLEGEASVSEAEITGEPLPATRGPGDAVAACTLNLDGSLLVEVKRTGGDTTVARVVRLVEEARAGKYPFARLVDRFSAAFVPFVLALAAATFGYWTTRAGMGEGVLSSLSVLLIACPCAIGIATPLACIAAAGRAAAAGVLVRSGDAFERLARAKRAFLDKTGTLTKGELELAWVTPAAGRTEASLFALAAAVEARSEHPVAVAIRREALRRGVSPVPVSAFRAFPGRGVEAVLALAGPDGSRPEVPGNSLVRIGTPSYAGGLAKTNGSNGSNGPNGKSGTNGTDGPNGTVVQVDVDGTYAGSLTFRDEVRPSARAAVADLEAKGLAVEVLSGDSAPSVAAFAAGFPGLAASAGLVPEEKLARVRASIEDGEEPLMVGDGINDAPALSGAGIGVTLESGTDLAREVSDVTILGGDLSKLPWTVGLARRTVAVARVNLLWAFLYNGIGLALAVTGHLHPLFGAVAMMASSLFVVVHSQRLSHFPLPGTEA